MCGNNIPLNLPPSTPICSDPAPVPLRPFTSKSCAKQSPDSNLVELQVQMESVQIGSNGLPMSFNCSYYNTLIPVSSLVPPH